MGRTLAAVNALRTLAGHTAVYGMSHIVGRLLYFLLTPFYTRVFTQQEFGQVTELYALVGFALIVLTHGMETALFRFLKTDGRRSTVFSTAMASVGAAAGLFLLLALSFQSSIASALDYSGQVEFIRWFALILFLDVLSAVPLAKLRADERPWLFAGVRLTDIGVNLGLNIFFLVVCRQAHLAGADTPLARLYDPAIGVGYVFLANLVASAVKFVLLAPQMRHLTRHLDTGLYRRMLGYALPLILVGMAGMVNETLDRAVMKHLLPHGPQENLRQLGIYGAVYKLSMFMALFVQAFRYAAEPFFFSKAGDADSPRLYAAVLKYFVIAGALVFLVVGLFVDVFALFIGPAFRSGLHILPILLLANLLLGVVVNLSIWYKLTDRTLMGAGVVGVGAVVTIVLNVVLVPRIGYAGAAWATLASYLVIAGLSLALGRRFYPVPYAYGRLTAILVGAIGLFLLLTRVIHPALPLNWMEQAASVVGIIGFAALVVNAEREELRGLLKR